MQSFLVRTATFVLTSVLGCCAMAVEVGDLAPEFTLAGRPAAIQLSAYRGKTVYLDFWASWCGPCKQSFPWMNDMQTRYGGSGLRIVAINVDQQPEAANLFLRSHPANFDLAFDAPGSIPKRYAIKAMPTSVLIGPDGIVLHVHSGFRDDERALLEQRIKQALRL